MKKILINCTVLAFCGLYSHAQNTYPYPQTGNIGIGTVTPESKMHINIGGGTTASFPTVSSRGNNIMLLQAHNNMIEIGNGGALNVRKAWILARHSTVGEMYGMHYSDLHLQPDIGDKQYYKGVMIGYSAGLTVTNGTHLAVNGRVGIGTTNPTEMLSVNGNIRAREIKVESQNWPDYVFSDSYRLPSLSEVKSYLQENRHLPGIPSAAEVQRDGQSVGEMNRLLLEKVEELTLHIIRQQEELDQLKSDIHRNSGEN